MYIIYNLLLTLVVIACLPYIGIKLLFSSRKKEWKQRLGQVDIKPAGRYIWVHCASVGEVNLAEIFINKLKENFRENRIILSVITPAGYKVASAKNLPVEQVFFLPVDLPFIAGKVTRKIKPEMLILVETELWPNLIKHAKAVDARIALVNGRISNKSYGKYLFLRPFFKKALSLIDLFLAREEIDRTRIINLGAEAGRVFVTGNMKYDQVPDRGNTLYDESSLREKTRSEFGFEPDDKIFTAGSVRENEEEPVISAFETARTVLSGENIKLKLLIAPRHINRASVMEKILKEKNISYRKRTDTGTASSSECFILDTHGELGKAYSIADTVFVGGSLVDKGGQNIIEPALMSKLIMFGPHMENFSEPSRILKEAGCAIEVRDRDELSRNIVFYTKNERTAMEKGAVAKKAVISMRGVTDRNIGYLKKLTGQGRFNKILIVQPSRIGDVIFSLPVLASLRKLYPCSCISWLVDDRCAELLTGNPQLDGMIVFPFKAGKDYLKNFKLVKLAKEILKLKKTLDEKRFDLTVDLHGLAKSAFVVKLAGAHRRIASPSSYGMKELSWLFSEEINSPGSGSMHCIDRHLLVMDYLGGEKIKEFNIFISNEDKKYTFELIKEMGRIAVVFPGGGWRSRRWFPERFAETADRLVTDYNFSVVFIGGKTGGSSEEGLIQLIRSLMKQKSEDLSNKLNLKQLGALLQYAKLFVGNEAGPMHLACALGTPVVAIIGPTNPSRTGPFGSNFIMVRKQVDCAPCRERDCKKVDCMRGIEVSDVLNAVNKILKP